MLLKWNRKFSNENKTKEENKCKTENNTIENGKTER